jgi:hypothetical protein
MNRVPLLAMLICCGLLAAGFAYALGYGPGGAESRGKSAMTVEVPAPLASSDETIGYR